MDDQAPLSTCKHCGAGIELDIGVGPDWPAWIVTKVGGDYLCGPGTWDDWFAGRARVHEPVDQVDDQAA